MAVADIMTSDVACCTPDTTIQEAAQMMMDCDCGMIPVVDSHESRRMQGVVTDRDICCRGVAKGLDPSTPVANCMTASVMSVTPEESLDEMMSLMEFHQIRRIPVCDENGAVVGVVSQADIALACPQRQVAEVVQEVSKPFMA